jgi:hypothetical protein
VGLRLSCAGVMGMRGGMACGLWIEDCGVVDTGQAVVKRGRRGGRLRASGRLEAAAWLVSLEVVRMELGITYGEFGEGTHANLQ